MQINLQTFTQEKTRNLSGHQRGKFARDFFCLDDLDHDPGGVEVIVPDYLDAIAPSFFQGLFAESVRKLGGREAFLNQYRFKAPIWIMHQIDRGIERSTFQRDGAFSAVK